eukprot:c26952_g1_i1.p1 GENE.c26952_g1_i1~~c26952_g1_i1.p1  ORF type:complete len:336 (+),score=71.71 c26952_g1_i1:124-1008(+)
MDMIINSAVEFLCCDSTKGKRNEVGEYRICQELGSGAYGTVFVGEHVSAESSSACCQFAVKVVSWTDVTSFTQAQHEKNISDLLGNHPNIIKIHDTVTEFGKYALIMDLAEGGNLFDEIVKTTQNKNSTTTQGLDTTTAKKYFHDVLSGLAHMHSCGVAHRDIKPENILLSQDKDKAMLCDFGLSTTSETAFLSCGTIDYIAPETLLLGSMYDTKKSDIWSCGVLLFCMLTGRLPFGNGKSDCETTNKILEGTLSFPTHCGVSHEAQDLIRRILRVDPESRLSIQDILSHPFMA